MNFCEAKFISSDAINFPYINFQNDSLCPNGFLFIVSEEVSCSLPKHALKQKLLIFKVPLDLCVCGFFLGGGLAI